MTSPAPKQFTNSEHAFLSICNRNTRQDHISCASQLRIRRECTRSRISAEAFQFSFLRGPSFPHYLSSPSSIPTHPVSTPNARPLILGGTPGAYLSGHLCRSQPDLRLDHGDPCSSYPFMQLRLDLRARGTFQPVACQNSVSSGELFPRHGSGKHNVTSLA